MTLARLARSMGVWIEPKELQQPATGEDKGDMPPRKRPGRPRKSPGEPSVDGPATDSTPE